MCTGLPRILTAALYFSTSTIPGYANNDRLGGARERWAARGPGHGAAALTAKCNRRRYLAILVAEVARVIHKSRTAFFNRF